MNDPGNLLIELEPVDAMLIMTLLTMIRSAATDIRALTRAIDNFNFVVHTNITLEQIREANDSLTIYRLLSQAGL